MVVSDQRARQGIFHRILTTTGVPGGTEQITADYSSTPTEFKCLIGATDIYCVTSVKFEIVTTAAMAYNKYGNLAQLTNGLQMQVTDSDDNIIWDITGAMKIKCNHDFQIFSADNAPIDYFGLKNKVFSWDGAQIGLDFIMLGSRGHKFILTANDNFTGLTAHRVHLFGRNTAESL